jgi:hypothetical protein
VKSPTAGELVEVQVEQTERGAWINSLKILGRRCATSVPDRDPSDPPPGRQVQSLFEIDFAVEWSPSRKANIPRRSTAKLSL